MKKIINYFSIFALLLLASCKPDVLEPTVIKVVGNYSEVKVQWPINGNWFFADTTYLSVNDSLVAKKMISKAGFALLTIGEQQVMLIVSPGKIYEVTPGEQPVIRGHDEKGQQGLQQFWKECRWGGRMPDTLRKMQDISQRISYVKKLKKQDLAPYSKLLESGEVSPEFYDLVETDRTVRSEVILAHGLLNTYSEQVEMNRDTATNSFSTFEKTYMPAWAELYHNINQRTDIIRTGYSFHWLSYLEYYNALKDSAKIVWAEMASAESDKFLQKHLIGDMLEYAWAVRIMAYSKSYDSGWIESFNKFKTIFPKSELIHFLQPSVDIVVAYTEAKNQIHEEVLFLDHENINTFAELREKVKGKVTYVDIWASWCGPCRGELPYSVKMHDKLGELGVQSLYLSVDKDKNEKEWKDMVNGLILKGFNLRANKKLHKDLPISVPSFGGIPRYIILDKEGKPVEWNAERPSSGNKLIEQLKKYL